MGHKGTILPTSGTWTQTSTYTQFPLHDQFDIKDL